MNKITNVESKIEKGELVAFLCLDPGLPFDENTKGKPYKYVVATTVYKRDIKNQWKRHFVVYKADKDGNYNKNYILYISSSPSKDSPVLQFCRIFHYIKEKVIDISDRLDEIKKDNVKLEKLIECIKEICNSSLQDKDDSIMTKRMNMKKRGM